MKQLIIFFSEQNIILLVIHFIKYFYSIILKRVYKNIIALTNF